MRSPEMERDDGYGTGITGAYEDRVKAYGGL